MDWIAPFEDISQLTQGSIVDNVNWGDEDSPVSIVLSSACDIEHKHASYLIVAAMYPASDVIAHSREYLGDTQDKDFEELSKKQQESVYRRLSDYIHHKAINRYYFIDCRDSALDMYMMVDFQKIQSIPIDEMSNLAPIAHLNSPLREQMIMQFASYTSRIPTDRVTSEETRKISEELIAEISEIKKQENAILADEDTIS